MERAEQIAQVAMADILALLNQARSEFLLLSLCCSFVMNVAGALRRRCGRVVTGVAIAVAVALRAELRCAVEKYPNTR